MGVPQGGHAHLRRVAQFYARPVGSQEPQQAGRCHVLLLRMGETGQAQHLRVLRERRQVDAVGVGPPPGGRRLFRCPPPVRTARLARPRPRNHRPPDGALALRRGQRPLHPRHVGTGLRGDRARVARHVPGGGGLLRLGSRGARGILPLRPLRPRDGAPEPAAVVEHVPRDDQREPADLHRHAGGHLHAGGFRSLRRNLLLRAEHRHQQSAFFAQPKGGGGPWLSDRHLQPAARAGSGRIRQSAGHQADDHRQTHADLGEVLSGAARRGHRRDRGAYEMRAGGRRCGAWNRARPRFHRRRDDRL